MIDFAYPFLEKTGENAWTVGAVSSSPEAGYVWHYWIPSLVVTNPKTLRMRALDEVLADKSPFIYPMELRWEFIEWFAGGAAKDFLTPNVPESVLKAAREGRAIIMPFFGHEARLFIFNRQSDGNNVSVYDLLWLFVRQHQLPPGAVWFLHANLNGDEEFRYWQQIRGIDTSVPMPFEMHCVDMYSYMTQALRHIHESGMDFGLKWDMCGTQLGLCHEAAHVSLQPLDRPLNEIYANVDGSLSNTLPEKLFLCMNKILRPHRRLIVVFLQLCGCLDRSFVSFRDDNPQNTRFDDPNLQKAWEQLIPKMPLTIDRDDLRTSYFYGYKPVRFDEFSVVKMVEAWPFSGSLVNIVNETHFSHDICFVSEKIWKPIVNCQPFIVTGTPGSLAYLKKLGFKTFEPFIDESYDSIKDDTARIMQIFKSVEKIGKMSPAQLAEFHKNVQPIVKYNLELLKSMTTPLEALFKQMWVQLSEKTSVSHQPSGRSAQA